jgi:hypothetical protein
MLGMGGTYRAVISANGPAQMLTYAFWGVLMAGMFAGMHINDNILICWGIVSLLVVPATVWGSKYILKYTLLVDMMLSAMILMMFIMHEPVVEPAQQFKYYTMALEGMTEAHRNNAHAVISDWFHIAALIWMTFHSAYLANLTHRQILERERFQTWT